MKETLYIYTRVSSKVQEEGTSLDEQKKVGLKISKDEGLKPKVLNEGGKSSNFEDCLNRPKLQDIMLGIEEGRIKHLYSWNTDRISRVNTFWNTFKNVLIKNGVTFYTKDGKYSFNSPEEQLMFNLLTSLGQYDNQLRTIRTHRGKMARIKMGYWLGGPEPFGYINIDKKLVENPKESKWVKFIYESFNKGKTLREIRQYLFINGVKTRRGNDKWSLGSIDSVLHNTHYEGHYKVHDKSLKEDIKCKCPQILPLDTILQAREKLKQRSYQSKTRTTKQKRYYMLKGLMWDKKTNYPYSGRMMNNTHQTYYCRMDVRPTIRGKKTNRYLNYERTNNLIWSHTIETLINSNTWKTLEKERIMGDKQSRIKTKRKNTNLIKKLKLEVEDFEKTMIQIPTLNVSPKILSETLKNCEHQILKLNSQIESLKKELNDYGTKDKWIDWVGKYQERLSIEGLKTDEEKREFLNQVVTRIDVTVKNKREHIFDIQFKLPCVNDKLTKKKVVDGQNTLTLTEITI
jgi:DNA invertase Pin-like site-specific DNA recombinase